MGWVSENLHNALGGDVTLFNISNKKVRTDFIQERPWYIAYRIRNTSDDIQSLKYHLPSRCKIGVRTSDEEKNTEWHEVWVAPAAHLPTPENTLTDFAGHVWGLKHLMCLVGAHSKLVDAISPLRREMFISEHPHHEIVHLNSSGEQWVTLANRIQHGSVIGIGGVVKQDFNVNALYQNYCNVMREEGEEHRIISEEEFAAKQNIEYHKPVELHEIIIANE